MQMSQRAFGPERYKNVSYYQGTVKQDENSEFEKRVILEEFKTSWERLLADETSTNSIKNWCIVTLTALAAFFIQYGVKISNGNPIVSIKNPIIALLPLFIIFFFALNDFFRQCWKQLCFKRLSEMEKEIKDKFGLQTHFLPEDVRKEYEMQESRDIRDILRKALFVRSFAFFYGFLFLLCSLFFSWLLSGSSDLNNDSSLLIVAIIFLIIGIFSILWIYFSARDFLRYSSLGGISMIVISLAAVISFAILVTSYLNLLSKISNMDAGVLGILANFVITVVNVGILYYISHQVRIARDQAKTAQKANQQAAMPILGITAIGQSRKDPDFKNLVVYVRHGIARDIECKIFKNKEETPFFHEDSHNTAVPPLRGDILLWIWGPMSIEEDVSKLNESGQLEFTAEFTYKSIFGDQYRSKYYLTIWRDKSGKLMKSENTKFEELPWDK